MNDTDTTNGSGASAVRPKRKNVLKTLGIVVVAAALVFFAIHVFQTARYSAPPNAAAADNAEVLARVGDLMVLPKEQPIIATINQADVVSAEPFYRGAQNGDKLLIFPMAGTAVIYSPTRNIIVNSGPFAVGSEPSGSTASDQNAASASAPN